MKIYIAIFLVLLFAIILLASDIPRIINYQGKLYDTGGPVNLSKNIGYRLYDAETGGNLRWEQAAHSISISYGLFSDTLGLRVDTTLATYSELWLEVWVEGSALSPRERILAAPWALTVADTAITNTKILWAAEGGVPTAGQVSATDMPIQDAGGYYTNDNVEAALQEVGTLAGGNYVLLAPSSAQNDATTNSAILINKTGASGNLIQIQQGGADEFVVDHSGNLDIGGNLTFNGSSPGQITAPTDGAIDIFADQGIEARIDTDDNATNATFKVSRDAAGNDLFIVNEANYIQVYPRIDEPTGGGPGGIYVNGNATGTDSVYFYNGSAWELFPTGDITGNYIQNQYSSEQSASWHITGKGRVHNTTVSDTALISDASGVATSYGIVGLGGTGASYGVYGELTSSSNVGYLAGQSYGVYGSVNAGNEYGVYGVNSSTSSSADYAGVKGELSGRTAVGALAFFDNGTPDREIAVYGSGGDYAGYFDGDIVVTSEVDLNYADFATRTTPPSSPAQGMLYYNDDADSNVFKYFDGTDWICLSTGHAAAPPGAYFWIESGGTPNYIYPPFCETSGEVYTRIYDYSASKGFYFRRFAGAHGTSFLQCDEV